MALTRTKLAAAAVLVAGGLGTVLFPLALAQEGAGAGGGPPGVTEGGSAGGAPPAGAAPQQGTPGGGGRGEGRAGGAGLPPGVAPGGFPGMPGMGGGMAMAGSSFSPGRTEWEHLLVDKPATAAEFKKLLDARGKEGWEFAGVVTLSSNTPPRAGAPPGVPMYTQGPYVVFKRHKGGGARAGGGGMMGAMAGMMPPMPGGGPGNPFGGPPMGPGGMTPAFRPGGMPGGPPAGRKPGGRPITVLSLKYAEAANLATVLEQVFPQGDLSATPDLRTNALIIRADKDTLEEVQDLIKRLDQPGAEKPGTGTRPGRGGGITPGPGIPPAP